MTNWFSFLDTQGAILSTGDCPEVVTFGETPQQYPQLISKTLLFSLDDRGIIGCSGQDTDKLLQGQLTCDIRQLSEQQFLKGALCTVKGRMISDSHLCRLDNGDTLLVSHRGLVSVTLETLKKFAVFYKTTLDDRSQDYRLFGLSGPEAGKVAQYLTGKILTGSDNSLHGDGLSLLQISARRWLVIVPAGQAEALWRQLSEQIPVAGLPVWRLLAIGDGEGEVRPETSEEFIPQMLNLQHTGAVSFKKGCYTGQEIVARMQYLGKLKRRMYRLSAAGPAPAPGTPLHLNNTRECGTVVIASPSCESHCELLAVLTEEAAVTDHLNIGDRSFAVEKLPLPYDVLFDTKPAGS